MDHIGETPNRPELNIDIDNFEIGSTCTLEDTSYGNIEIVELD